MRMLVVDDSKAMRMIVVRELKKGGFSSDEIVEADSGAAALEVVRSGGVEVVLSDWNMPGMTGMDLLKQLRAEGSAVHFGFITSESASSTHDDALAAGADFFLTKPFTGSDLSQALGTLLGRSITSEGNDQAKGAPTVAGVLEGLLRRSVQVKTSPEPPRHAMPRAAATYVNSDGQQIAMTIAELGVAAAAGAALSLIPAATAAEWAKAGALPANIEQNYYEVANVLASVFSARGGRCHLKELTFVSDGEWLAQAEEISKAKQVTLEVAIEGYNSGRIALVRF